MNNYQRLFILVEGLDDSRFCNKIIKTRFKPKYDYISIHEYSNQNKDFILKFIKSINSMGADYIFISDFNKENCITAKKQKILCKYKNKLDENNIVIVKEEIESWYMAGMDDTQSKLLEIPKIKETNNFTKEHFNDFQQLKNRSRIDLMVEMLKSYNIKIAKQKNKSFKYFIEKYLN